MLTFIQLQQKAEFLPIKLNNSYAKLYTMGGLFCSCLPFMRPQLFDDVYLIQSVAKCLNYYSFATEKDKLSVLQGMYLYIWERYESSVQRVLNKPLLDALSAHLEVESLETLDKNICKESFQALDEFCNWVYRNRSHRELGELYRAFPNDMQATIHTRRFLSHADEAPTWGGTLSSLLKDIGIHRLF